MQNNNIKFCPLCGSKNIKSYKPINENIYYGFTECLDCKKIFNVWNPPRKVIERRKL